MACGLRKTVVTMKKMSSRNATSTIGVMSMRIATRRLGRRRPPLAFASGSAVSTAPIGASFDVGACPTRRGAASSVSQLGHQVERGSSWSLQRVHDVGDRAELGVLVALDDDAGAGIAAPRQ